MLILVVAMFGLLGRNRRPAFAFAGLTCVLLLWIAIRIVFGANLNGSIGLIQILVGPLFLFGALGFRAPPPSRSVMAGVTIYFLLCAAIEILAPSVYQYLASSMMSRASVTDGHRGISLLTPEPTYAAISAIYFLLLAWWSGKHFGFRFRWIEPALMFCFIGTGTTYIAVMLLALACVCWPRLMVLVIASTVILSPRIGLVALGSDESVRAVVAVARLLSTDFNNFLPAISLADCSIGSRLVTNAASYLTLIHSPLGLGLDCEAVPKAFDAAGFDFAFENEVLMEVLKYGCLKPQCYAATVGIGLGIWSLAFLSLLIISANYSLGLVRHSVWAAPLAIALVLLFVQGQLTSPIPWLLVFFSLVGYPDRLAGPRGILVL